MNKCHIRKIESQFGKIIKRERVSSWRQVYKLHFKSSVLRLDILKKNDPTLMYHKMCLDQGLICFPKIQKVFKEGNLCLKISEWIEGRTYSDIFRSGSLEKSMVFKMGSSVAKVNMISQNRLHLHNDDITYHNVMLDRNGNFIMFDLDRLSFIKDVDGALVKTLLKRISNKEMIDSFLEGYKKHRDINNLISLCQQRNWKWKWKKKGV
jgi:hypothetical protein